LRLIGNRGNRGNLISNLKNLPALKKFILLFLLIPAFGIAQEKTSDNGKSLNGIASFYASRFNGLRTATGEIFKHSNLTAASNNFKINSWVKVTNLRNNKSVIVRINDRMHERMAKMGRIVDLTTAAARLLGVVGDGLLKVKVENLGKGDLLGLINK
jgi:rare lipoprotein A